MTHALQIANYIISKDDVNVNNLYLQKLLYFLQINYMVRNKGELLFEDSMEKWKLGPVIPDVYHAFKDNGPTLIKTTFKDLIKIPNQENNSYTLKFEDYQLTDQNIQQFIDQHLSELLEYDRFTLVELTHEHEPWKKDEYRINNGVRNLKYDYNELMNYFSKNKKLLLIESE